MTASVTLLAPPSAPKPASSNAAPSPGSASDKSPFVDVLARRLVREPTPSRSSGGTTDAGHIAKPGKKTSDSDDVASDDALAGIDPAATPDLPTQALDIAAQSAAQAVRSRALTADPAETGKALLNADMAGSLGQGIPTLRGDGTPPVAQAGMGRASLENGAAAAIRTSSALSPSGTAQHDGPGATLPREDRDGVGEPLSKAIRAGAAIRNPADAAPDADAGLKKINRPDADMKPGTETMATAPSLVIPVHAATDQIGTHAAIAAAQAAASAPAQPGGSTAPAAPLHISVPVGHDQWGAALGKQVVTIAQDAATGTHTAELRLDPPDLGPLRIQLQISDGIAHASFMSAHGVVRQALEAAMPQLQQAMSQAGVSLGQTDVSDRMPQGFAGQQQEGQSAGQGRAGANGGGDQAGSLPGAPPLPTAPVRAANALVDTFA